MILTYHHINKEFRNSLDVEKDIFEKQICLLLENGKKFVYLEEYNPKNPNHVVLRFDDGNKSILKYALPILKKYKLKFEVFIVGDFVSKKKMLNKFDLWRLVRNGGRLEYHSKSHLDLSLITDDEKINEEIIVPNYLRKIDKKGFKFFAYPYWKYNDNVIQVLKNYYAGAVSGNGFAEEDIDYMYKLDSVRMRNDNNIILNKKIILERNKIVEQIEQLNNFYYLPNKGNLGDCVIAACTYKFFENENLEYKIFSNLPKEPFDLIYGGGGLWTSDFQLQYQKILGIFKSKNLRRCIILPSSFKDCDDLIEILDERFVVFAREERSYKYLKNSSAKAEVLMADDMVINANISELQKEVKNKYFVSKNLFENIKTYRKFYLRVDKQIKTALKKYNDFKIGYFLRNDEEKTIENKPNNNFDLSNCKSADWKNKKLTFAMAKTFIDTLDRFKIIVTDRLHVGISSANLGKKVYLIDNSYGKNSAVYDYSLKNKENIELVKYEEVKGILKNG